VNLSRPLSRLAPAIAVAALCMSPLAAAAEDKVLATVDGKNVTESQLAYAEEEIGEGLAHLSPSQRRRYLTEYLIEMQIFSAAADAAKLGSGPDFDARMKYWKEHALKDVFLAKTVKEKVTEEEAKKFYDDRAAQMATEEEVKASHILVKDEAQAKEIAKKLIDGGNFEALAKEFSEDPGSKDKGGVLGFFGRGQMVKEFELVAFTMEKGETSQPVKTQFGWHIIRVDDKRKKEPPKFDDVKKEILDRMGQQKKIEEAQVLRAKAKVDYVDPEVKKQVEDDKVAAEARKKAMEEQMKAQVEQMKGKEAADGAKPEAAPAPTAPPAEKK
jgi:peptidyl-prolyl cis-trans isomerase C